MESLSPHAAILCSPGMGHIIPALELAKRLVVHRTIPRVTFFLASISNSAASQAETQVLQSTAKEKLFNIIQLPPVDITALVGPDATVGAKLPTIMRQTRPLLLSAISTMEAKPTLLITDLFGSPALPVAENLNMSKCVFITGNAWLLALALHTPTLDKEIQGQYSQQNKPLLIPGCKPIHPSDLFEPLLDRTHLQYQEFLRVCEGLAVADGFLVNTFHELEPKTLAALSNGQIAKVTVYPVGPLIRETRQIVEENRSYVLDWLDKQDEESVVYVSLGSGYSMSYEQIKELALGLELSEKKFVWSIRPPATKASHDHYLTAGEDETQSARASGFEPSNYWPDELHRIQNMGILIKDWTPQLDILKHPSVGGFLSHCGWNSVLESVSCGLPMVGWPLFAEQRMNAAMLAKEVGVAIRLEVQPSTNIVGREEIAKAIGKIMNKEDEEGCAMRDRVKELMHRAQRAWSEDGSSYLALSEMASTVIKIGHSNEELLG